MNKDLTTKSFDYSGLSKDAVSDLIWYASEIQRQGITHVESGIAMGKLLCEARERCVDGEMFEEWVERECRRSIRTAYNYMSAYEHFGNFANFAKIEISAMYMLTSNQKAKNAALKLAEKGKDVTHAIAQRLIEKYSPSDRGKPGGGSPSSSKISPAPSGPASGGAAGSKQALGDLGKCPNCAGTKWVEDEEGLVCKKCKQPHGEPAGDVDEDHVKTGVSKLFKSAEATMRAADDLNHICPNENHEEAVRLCKQIMTIAKGWK